MALKVPPTQDQDTSVLSQEQGRAFFDSETRRVTGMSGETFLHCYDAGEILPDDDTPEGREVGYLILLIPFGR